MCTYISATQTWHETGPTHRCLVRMVCGDQGHACVPAVGGEKEDGSWKTVTRGHPPPPSPAPTATDASAHESLAEASPFSSAHGIKICAQFYLNPKDTVTPADPCVKLIGTRSKTRSLRTSHHRLLPTIIRGR